VAAASVTVLLGVTVVIPTIWVSHSLVQAFVQGLDQLVPSTIFETWSRFISQHPTLEHNITSLQRLAKQSPSEGSLLDTFGLEPEHLVRSSLHGVFNAVLTLFIVFFFLRDGRYFIDLLQDLVPLSANDTDLLIKRVADTIHATLFGMVAVSAVQGALGAVLLCWLDLPSALVWGTIMMLLALLPYLGAFIVWIPVALFLTLQGDWYRATVTAAWGAFVIGFSDNLLYPYLVGHRLHYHSLLVFFFLLGGVIVFGSVGLVLGPVLLATTERLLWIWCREVRIKGGHTEPS
jgi:predicted PurR-regulated permease PerM